MFSSGFIIISCQNAILFPKKIHQIFFLHVGEGGSDPNVKHFTFFNFFIEGLNYTILGTKMIYQYFYILASFLNFGQISVHIMSKYNCGDMTHVKSRWTERGIT